MPPPHGRCRMGACPRPVEDLAATVAKLSENGAYFRNDIVDGPGGRQILVEDPSGNVIELFEPRAS
jgi:predicted enzyme related to lactoylglutathione lyase